MKNYRTKPCGHCGRHSRIDSDWCPWCFRPYRPGTLWWEIVKLAAVMVLAVLVVAVVFL